MPRIRGAAGPTTNTLYLIIGCVLLLLFVLGVLQQQVQKRQRRTRKRKEDLQRHIRRLNEQLKARENRLRCHDGLKETGTPRVETSRRDDEEWARLMEVGERIYGDNWNVSNGDEPSLRDQMELNKDELLEYKRSLQNGPESSRQNAERQSSAPGDRKYARRPSKCVLPLLKLQPMASPAVLKLDGPKFLPPQWHSTRAKAGSLLSAVGPAYSNVQANKSDAGVLPPTQKMVMPPLDVTRLGGRPTRLVLPQGVPKRGLETSFRRQTRLAALLRKKK